MGGCLECPCPLSLSLRPLLRPTERARTASKERRRSVARKRSRAALSDRLQGTRLYHLQSPLLLLLSYSSTNEEVIRVISFFLCSQKICQPSGIRSSCGVVQRARGREVSPQSLPSTNIFLPFPDCPPLTSSWKGRFYAACIHAAAVALLFMGLNAIA